ncbi:hypothetical protein MACH08_31130 [Oceanobacillus kimchii]|uniref:Uncharacterized protein n=1 Tax=Oceanobacillus kimchii TaxID=746691 RepID=A0ABQ5TKE5_9BACI|nr:hypothetical protein MACH08_31130 [Oceanobacillus kimchii]
MIIFSDFQYVLVIGLVYSPLFPISQVVFVYRPGLFTTLQISQVVLDFTSLPDNANQ